MTLLLVTVLCSAVSAMESSSGKTYVDPPRDITSEAKYLALKRFAYTGQMDQAESRATTLLDGGYRQTRYECQIHETLASGYEKLGDRNKAIEAWRRCMLSSDPAKGSYIAAENKIRQHGGTPPPRPYTTPVARAPERAPSRAPAASSESSDRRGLLSWLRPSSRDQGASPAPASARPVQASAATPPPVRPARAETPTARATQPPSSGSAPRVSARLAAEPDYRQATRELASGAYQDLRVAVKRLEGLLIDRGYEGTGDSAELHARLAEAYRGLSDQHARWAGNISAR